MKIILRKLEHKKTYTTVELNCLLDTSLSWGAKGLHLYLVSRANLNNWNLNFKDIRAKSINGRDTTRKYIEELKKTGYLQIIRNTLKNGKFDWTWIVSEMPYTEIQYMDKTTQPYTEKPYTGNPYHITNYSILIKKEKKENKIKEKKEKPNPEIKTFPQTQNQTPNQKEALTHLEWIRIKNKERLNKLS